MIEEKMPAGSHILTEIGGLSRDDGLISGAHLTGTVLAKVTSTKEWVQLKPTGTDGSEKAAGVLFRHVDASAASKKAVVNARMTAVRASSLVWPLDITDAQKTAALEQLEVCHIIAR